MEDSPDDHASSTIPLPSLSTPSSESPAEYSRRRLLDSVVIVPVAGSKSELTSQDAVRTGQAQNTARTTSYRAIERIAEEITFATEASLVGLPASPLFSSSVTGGGCPLITTDDLMFYTPTIRHVIGPA